MMYAVQNAIATNEVNAAMGVICATPTAGSSGTLPGVLFLLKKRLNLTEEQMIRFLFNAGGFGLVIANNMQKLLVLLVVVKRKSAQPLLWEQRQL